MLDYIQFINDNSNLTSQQKTDLLFDFCDQYGYQETVVDQDTGEEIQNPTTRKEFANQKITDYLIQTVNTVRIKRAKAAADYTELEIT